MSTNLLNTLVPSNQENKRPANNDRSIKTMVAKTAELRDQIKANDDKIVKLRVLVIRKTNARFGQYG
ncbi:unnamed protein product [Adineta ricciae]|uniref:Uncharacterized protein n=1 Tax=Adineta ricciae TaxID=249248 RepID=A0A815H408_ADIRI|nr:unnamed protein product [Adineta ricciae]